MNGLDINKVMDMSVQYEVNGTLLKRSVKAGKTDTYGKNWLLIDTEDENGEINRQWIEMSFFQRWLNLIECAA